MYINNSGHMTKVAAMHIYGKNLLCNWLIDYRETCHSKGNIAGNGQ